MSIPRRKLRLNPENQGALKITGRLVGVAQDKFSKSAKSGAI